MSSVVKKVTNLFMGKSGKERRQRADDRWQLGVEKREQKEATERKQQQFISFQEEQAENARSFLEETRAYNEMKLQEIQAEKDRLSAEREAEKAKSAEADRLASDKRKARGKRRLALIKSGERSAEGLGTPNVGRKKLLGN